MSIQCGNVVFTKYICTYGKTAFKRPGLCGLNIKCNQIRPFLILLTSQQILLANKYWVDKDNCDRLATRNSIIGDVPPVGIIPLVYVVHSSTRKTRSREEDRDCHNLKRTELCGNYSASGCSPSFIYSWSISHILRTWILKFIYS